EGLGGVIMPKRPKRRRAELVLVPRLGPASNLRPAGAHQDQKLYDRNKIKAVLRREAENGFDNSRRA
ncbi:MAG TPA: hypothetical protein VMS32_02265, partial [Verrucomicrobiae bacterium]|nr:hypothetical protein [Verrucomicrobiae bacterium]